MLPVFDFVVWFVLCCVGGIAVWFLIGGFGGFCCFGVVWCDCLRVAAI